MTRKNRHTVDGSFYRGIIPRTAIIMVIIPIYNLMEASAASMVLE